MADRHTLSERFVSDPYHYGRQKWIGGWGILIGGLLGGFVAWWFAVAIAVGVMALSIVDIFVISKREATRK